jgi:hypothetical protein
MQCEPRRVSGVFCEIGQHSNGFHVFWIRIM